MIKRVLFGVVCFLVTHVSAQQSNWGVLSSSSLNYVCVKGLTSNDNIYSTKIFLNPGITVGGYFNYQSEKRFQFITDLSYKRTYLDCQDFTMMDVNGSEMGSFARRMVSNHIRLSFLPGIKASSFSINAGIYIDNLLLSTTVIDYEVNTNYGIYPDLNKRYANHYFSLFTGGVSIYGAYNFSVVSLFTRINIGLTDRIATSTNTVKEFDRSVEFGVLVRLNGHKE